jgi:hypothetical protein
MERTGLTPDEVEFLKIGVTQYLPAVRALGSFVDMIAEVIRGVLRPYDERLQAKGLAFSGSKIDYYPKIGAAHGESALGIQIKAPGRSTFYIEIYPEEPPAKSMWVGGWLWLMEREKRTTLYELCQRHSAECELTIERESDGTVYLGVYTDYRKDFPTFAPLLNNVVDTFSPFWTVSILTRTSRRLGENRAIRVFRRILRVEASRRLGAYVVHHSVNSKLRAKYRRRVRSHPQFNRLLTRREPPIQR